MTKAAGARERHMELCRYHPLDPKKAERPNKNGKTLKLRGDLIIGNPLKKSYKVERKGWF